MISKIPIGTNDEAAEGGSVPSSLAASHAVTPGITPDIALLATTRTVAPTATKGAASVQDVAANTVHPDSASEPTVTGAEAAEMASAPSAFGGLASNDDYGGGGGSDSDSYD